MSATPQAAIWMRTVLFLTLFAVLSLAVELTPLSDWTAGLLGQLMVMSVTSVLVMLGYTLTIDGHVLSVPSEGLAFAITPECVAIPAYITLICLSIVVHRGATATWRSIGILCLGFFVLNCLRVVSLAGVWIFMNDFFHFAHEYLWNGVFFAIVTLVVAHRLIYAPIGAVE